MRLSLLVLLLLPLSVFAQKTYHVSAPQATVYGMPNTGSAVQAQLKRGDEVQYLKIMESGEWAKVQVNGKIGYIDINVIAEGPFKQEVKKATSKKYHVSVFQTAIYGNTKFSANKIKTLSQNDVVEVIGDAGEWGKVKISNGIGYVFMAHLEEGLPKKEKPQKEQKTETYKVSFQTKVYTKPNKKSAVVKNLMNDQMIEVLEVVNGEWAKIRLEKGFGYVDIGALEKQKASSAGGATGGNPNNQGKTKNPKKFGAFCRDGSTDYTVGPKTCSKGNGVKMWIYKAP